MLELEHISTGYGAIEAVHDVSVEVPDGSLVSIVGANGAGKTALLLGVTGQHPHRGRVVLAGTDLTGLPAYQRARAGLLLVPEGRMVFDGMTVRDNLISASMHRAARSIRSERLEFVFELFPRLRERQSQRADMMSGGEQQMCALGRTLMGNPKVLLLDEPSLGLAPRVVEELFAAIQKLRETGLTILLVEQNVQHALAMTDFGYVLEQGRIVLSGPGQELLGDRRVQEAYLAGAVEQSREVA